MHLEITPLVPRPSRILACSLLSAAAMAGGGTSGWTERVSLASDGTQLTLGSVSSEISADGRYVAFATADALVPEDTNGASDIYVRDRQTGTTVCASVNFYGEIGNGPSSGPSISADGGHVAFHSEANNLGGIDANGAMDVYVRDLANGLTRLASGANGSIVAANGNSLWPDLSADGRYVVYETAATNVLPGDTNGESDIYLRDLVGGGVERVSLAPGGEPDADCHRPSVSANGRRVSFHTTATNMHFMDANGRSDVFLFDLDGPTLLLASFTPGGASSNGHSYRASLSSNGERLAYLSTSTDLDPLVALPGLDIFVTDLDSMTVEAMSVSPTGESSNAQCESPYISRDGTHVAFSSLATNLLPGSTAHRDIYLREVGTGRMWLVDRPDGATQSSDDSSYAPSVSDLGRFVAFATDGTVFDPADTNHETDIYVRTTIEDPVAYCTSTLTASGCEPTLSASGLPSIRQATDFVLRAGRTPANKAAMLFYGFGGRTTQPFLGGTLCVDGALKRTPIATTVALGAGPCDGFLAFDMNAFAAGDLGGNPDLRLSLLGTRVNAQLWGRDPNSLPHGVFLTNAIEFVVGP